MTHTPMTRPPGRPRTVGGRPPRGFRPVALRPSDRKHRDNLIEAAAALRTAGQPELADSVDYVLSPEGVSFVGRLRIDRVEDERAPSMAMRIDPGDKALIKERAQAAGDNLAEVLSEGLAAFVAGQFEPLPLPRATRGGAAKVNLNVRPDEDVRRQAEAKCKDMTASGTRTTVSNVGAAYLSWKYRVGAYAPKSGKDTSAG